MKLYLFKPSERFIAATVHELNSRGLAAHTLQLISGTAGTVAYALLMLSDQQVKALENGTAFRLPGAQPTAEEQAKAAQRREEQREQYNSGLDE